MNIETKKAYSEVNEFLKLIDEEMLIKIPEKTRNLFKKNMDKSYTPNIKKSISIKKQGLSRKAIAIISWLNLKYWCKNEEDKSRLLQIYKNNQINYDKVLTESQVGFDPEQIFNIKCISKIEQLDDSKQLDLIVENKGYRRIFKKIKTFIMNIINK